MSDDKSGAIFQVVSAVLGISAFLWNLFGYLWTYIFSHLFIDFSYERIKTSSGEKLKVTSTVENKGSIAKKIDYAFLLILPENQTLKKSLLTITGPSESSDTTKKTVASLLHQLMERPRTKGQEVFDRQYLMYPLTYFYEEQFQIGNEKVKYSCLLDLRELQTNQAYEIRLITISKHFFKTYLRYRTTSDLFIHQS